MAKKKNLFGKNPTLKSLLLQGCEIKYPTGYSIRITHDQSDVYHIRGSANLFDNVIYKIDPSDKLSLKNGINVVQVNRKSWEAKERKNIKKIKIDEQGKN